MQPQNSYTGQDQRYVGQNGQFTAPVGVAQAEQGHEAWIQEVQKITADTAQNPRKRAEMLSELKVRYQQQVLGLTTGAKSE